MFGLCHVMRSCLCTLRASVHDHFTDRHLTVLLAPLSFVQKALSCRSCVMQTVQSSCLIFLLLLLFPRISFFQFVNRAVRIGSVSDCLDCFVGVLEVQVRGR